VIVTRFTLSEPSEVESNNGHVHKSGGYELESRIASCHQSVSYIVFLSYLNNMNILSGITTGATTLRQGSWIEQRPE